MFEPLPLARSALELVFTLAQKKQLAFPERLAQSSRPSPPLPGAPLNLEAQAWWATITGFLSRQVRGRVGWREVRPESGMAGAVGRDSTPALGGCQERALRALGGLTFSAASRAHNHSLSRGRVPAPAGSGRHGDWAIGRLGSWKSEAQLWPYQVAELPGYRIATSWHHGG